MRFFTIIAGFTIANFLWEAVCRDPNWKTAFERSYFQAIAVPYVWCFGVQA